MSLLIRPFCPCYTLLFHALRMGNDWIQIWIQSWFFIMLLSNHYLLASHRITTIQPKYWAKRITNILGPRMTEKRDRTKLADFWNDCRNILSPDVQSLNNGLFCCYPSETRSSLAWLYLEFSDSIYRFLRPLGTPKVVGFGIYWMFPFFDEDNSDKDLIW